MRGDAAPLGAGGGRAGAPHVGGALTYSGPVVRTPAPPPGGAATDPTTPAQETPDDTMSTRQTLMLGNERFRVGPWHADPEVAYLALLPEHPRPSVDGLRRCAERLSDEGFTSIITSALHTDEAAPFIDAGFAEYDRLRVLAHDLRGVHLMATTIPATPSGLRLRRARRRDHAAALRVDGRAFPSFWRLDRVGLDEAIGATPRSRFRIAELDGDVIGYAVTGRAGDQGFLQRLATEPTRSGQGVGSSLVLDALRWAARRRVRRMLVNTQYDNQRALDLYRHLGFELTPTDLVVLARPIP
jgi:GNAT superfamily N-acetyltransferase